MFRKSAKLLLFSLRHGTFFIAEGGLHAEKAQVRGEPRGTNQRSARLVLLVQGLARYAEPETVRRTDRQAHAVSDRRHPAISR